MSLNECAAQEAAQQVHKDRQQPAAEKRAQRALCSCQGISAHYCATAGAAHQRSGLGWGPAASLAAGEGKACKESARLVQHGRIFRRQVAQ